MKSKWLGIATAVCLTLSLIAIPVVAGCAPEEEAPPEGTYQWVIGEPFPEGTVTYEACVKWIEMVEEASDGRMKFTLYPGTLLGNYIEQTNALTRGEQDFAFSWATAANMPRSDVLWMGYIYRDWDDCEQAWMPGGWAEQLAKTIWMEDADILPLGSMPGGQTVITSKVRFAPMAADKKMKLRVPPSPIAMARFEAQGFNAVDIAMSEVESALLLGTIDGVGYISSEQAWQYREAYSYLYFWGSGFLPLQNVVSLKLFNSLSKEDQELLVRVGEEWTYIAWEMAKERIEWIYSELEASYGIEIIELTDEEWEHNASLAIPLEVPIMEETVGVKLVDIVRQNVPWIAEYTK